ncbi:hypothetical protein [Moorena sp. SIO1G6]|uniref:hypothetical protein n=1 Tax=Moorena sp. SIO1G6 TaxID=2607840 RepID=UPI00257A23CB|nr:hypothetical protein [Moorena sp. SIO1G6]
MQVEGVAGCCLKPWPKGHATRTTYPTPNATGEQPVNLQPVNLGLSATRSRSTPSSHSLQLSLLQAKRIIYSHILVIKI